MAIRKELAEQSSQVRLYRALLGGVGGLAHRPRCDPGEPPRRGGSRCRAARAHRGPAFPVIMQTAESQYPDVYQRARELSVRLIAKDDIERLLVPAVREALRLTVD